MLAAFAQPMSETRSSLFPVTDPSGGESADLLRAHIAAADFPCVGAKSAMARGTLEILGARDIASAWDDLRIHDVLRRSYLEKHAMPEDIERALRAGMSDYWTKPLDFRAFMTSIDALFGPAPAAQR